MRVVVQWLFLAMIAFLQVGCWQRKPSSDIFHALNRKDHNEAEVREIVLADPSVVSARDEPGRTALYLAAEKGMNETVELLLKNGAAVNSSGFAGGTPLSAASGSGYLHTVKLLLLHGANPNIADESGHTPVYEVIMWCPKELRILELLVHSGASLDVTNKDGRSLIQICRDRRRQYEAHNPQRTTELTRRILGEYDKIEAFLLAHSKGEQKTEQGGPANPAKPGG